MITTLRPAQVKIALDGLTYARLQAIAKSEGKSLSGLVRELCERHTAPIAGLILEWESAA